MNKIIRNIIIFSIIIVILSISPINANENTTIHLAEGIYNITQIIEINKDTTIIGESQNKTIIQCIDLEKNQIIKNNYKKLKLINLTLKKVTIQNTGLLICQNITFINCTNSFGGTIENNQEYENINYLTGCKLNNCIFTNNSGKYGGVIYSNNIAITINNTKFINNHALSYGGVINSENCNLSINNSYFINDHSLKDCGGAIYSINCKNIQIINTNFINCTGRFGGSICLLSSKVEIKNSTFKNNKAKYDGGAIYQMYGEITINNSKFLNNQASNGSGLFTDSENKKTITNSLFKCNPNYAIFSNGANLTLNNNAFIENEIHTQRNYNTFIEDSNYDIYLNNLTFKKDLPLKYSLIDEGFITSVKNQENGGNCWAFSALASLESCILKAGGGVNDFSESNMKNLAAYYSAYGRNIHTNTGGFNDMAIAYLTSWLGPVNEYDDNYDDYNHLSPVLKSLYHVQNIYILPPRTSFEDNILVKLAIYNYGGVAVTFNYNLQYFNNNTNSYYNPQLSNVNHAVTIVGWDDNYSRNNFKQTPAGDGAFIVKNSWGENWGENGYFYISYYDSSLLRLGFKNEAYTFILNDTTNYNKNYQYDIGGVSNYQIVPSYNVFYANEFNSTGEDNLAAISTYFNKNTNYTIFIYVNNDLKLEQSGFSQVGYYTFKLNQLIPLKKGDVFKVVIKVKSNLRNACFPISQPSKSQSPTRDNSKPNTSFYKYDNMEWMTLNYPVCIKAFTTAKEDEKVDLTIKAYNNHYGENLILSIQFSRNITSPIIIMLNDKSYTTDVKNGIGHIEINELLLPKIYKVTVTLPKIAIFNYNIQILKQNINLYSTYDNSQFIITAYDANGEKINGELLFNLNNEKYKINIKNGIGKITFNQLKPGRYNYTLIFLENDYYMQNKANGIINIDSLKIHTSIIGNDVEMYYKNGSYEIKLIDSYKKPLAGFEIIFTINDENYKRTTNSQGIAAIKLNLKSNNYTIKAKFNGDELYSSCEITNTICILTTLQSKDIVKMFKNNTQFEVYLTNQNGYPLPELKVEFNINGEIYTRLTNNNGIAKLNINLAYGNYTITSLNIETGEMKSNIITVLPLLVENHDLVKYFKNQSKYSLKALDEHGKPIANKTITFNIDGVFYTRLTNNNGIASFDINLRPSTYIITAIYNECMVSNIVIVKSTIISENLTMNYNNKSSFKITLLDERGKIVAKNTPVILNINGVIYTKFTNNEGVASLNINLQKGAYIITSFYNNLQQSNTIVVK